MHSKLEKQTKNKNQPNKKKLWFYRGYTNASIHYSSVIGISQDVALFSIRQRGTWELLRSHFIDFIKYRVYYVFEVDQAGGYQ